MDNFLHGGEYPETEGVRSEPCSSCAFGNGADTVRTSDITITELVEQTADLDDFVCHTAECGKSRTCKRRSEEHTSELQSLMRISYAVFCLNKKNQLPIIKSNQSNIYHTTTHYSVTGTSTT